MEIRRWTMAQVWSPSSAVETDGPGNRRGAGSLVLAQERIAVEPCERSRFRCRPRGGNWIAGSELFRWSIPFCPVSCTSIKHHVGPAGHRPGFGDLQYGLPAKMLGVGNGCVHRG